VVIFSRSYVRNGARETDRRSSRNRQIGSERPLGVSIQSAWKIQARHVTTIVQAAVASVLLKFTSALFLPRE
jgi:hypothetical protein